MQVSASWVNGHRFIGKSGSGHGVIMDGSGADDPEGSLGPSPMEMLLLGMAGCSGIDVVHILKKSREDVQDCIVELRAERAQTEPKIFTKIHALYRVKGKGLSLSKVENAVRLSAEKYCSASVILGQTAEIIREIEIEDDA